MPGALPPAVFSSPFRAAGHSGLQNQMMTVSRFTAIAHSTPKGCKTPGRGETPTIKDDNHPRNPEGVTEKS
jgi:hypothetical protein